MSKPCVFVSCGQWTENEKQLGEEITAIVKKVTGHDAFFAQQVHDFNGLRDNILKAIQNCIGFIAVMHPRGTIIRPDGTRLTRASVWVEQEIAIAAYIQFTAKKTLPVIVFIHESVGREGIRDLLHLNPIAFKDEADVLKLLPNHLELWKTNPTGTLRLELESHRKGQQDGHHQFQLDVYLVNDSNRRIETYDAVLRFPGRLLKHWSTIYAHEVGNRNAAVREFRFDQTKTGALLPHAGKKLMTFMEYCWTCGVDDSVANTGFPESVENDVVEVTVWIDEQEYSIRRTFGELHREPLRQVLSGITSLPYDK
jgi:hypothetical protein